MASSYEPSPSHDLTEMQISLIFPNLCRKPICLSSRDLFVLQAHTAGLQPAHPLRQRWLPLPHSSCGSLSEVQNHVGGEMGRVHRFMSLPKLGQGSKGGTCEWGSESFPSTWLLCPWLLWLYKACAWSIVRGAEREERKNTKKETFGDLIWALRNVAMCRTGVWCSGRSRGRGMQDSSLPDQRTGAKMFHGGGSTFDVVSRL